jgi:chlorobactene glucosyltransferase
VNSTAVAFMLVAVPALLVLANVAYNLAVWPRGRPSRDIAEGVSVLIPARNEEANIRRCVQSVLAGTLRPDEVVVYDDGSTDRTPELLAGLAATAGIRVIEGAELPRGWMGKPHACARLAAAATGEILVYLDADVVLARDGLARITSLFPAMRADLVSAGVRQEMGTAAERLVIPLLHLSYLAWLPLPLIWGTRDPRLLVANGQLLALRKSSLEEVGGWEAVRTEIVDDMAIARAVKAQGGCVVFANGIDMAVCRMYGSAGELWAGFSKNLYEGIGGRPGMLFLVLLVHAWVFLLPYAALAAVAFAPWVLLPALLGVLANVSIRALLVVSCRHPASGMLLHPLGVVALLGIAVNSYRWSRRGEIRWRGRSYPARAGREASRPRGVA